MIKVSNVEIINDLINRDIVVNANTLGKIQTTDNFEVFVDNIDNPKGFIANFEGWHTIYATEDNIAFKLISEMDFCENPCFAGIPDKYYDMIKEVKPIQWEEQCFLYYLEEERLDISNIKHRVESLKPEDALTVNEYYTYKEEGSLEYIKECIERGPSSVIYDEKGEPVSWALMREDNSMGVMYTKKEFRGQGLAVSVSIDLAHKVINSGRIPYVHIVTDNLASISLAESIGFKRYGKIVWFGVK